MVQQAFCPSRKFFDGLEFDGYRMPNGEFRVGLQGASLVLGFAENWLRRLLNRETGTQIKTLRGLGFTEETQKVVHESNKGSRSAETISLRDFNRLIAFAVSKGKKAALALQLALTEVALNDFFRDAFGVPSIIFLVKLSRCFPVSDKTRLSTSQIYSNCSLVVISIPS
jgi:hypothetical protein